MGITDFNPRTPPPPPPHTQKKPHFIITNLQLSYNQLKPVFINSTVCDLSTILDILYSAHPSHRYQCTYYIVHTLHRYQWTYYIMHTLHRYQCTYYIVHALHRYQCTSFTYQCTYYYIMHTLHRYQCTCYSAHPSHTSVHTIYFTNTSVT